MDKIKLVQTDAGNTAQVERGRFSAYQVVMTGNLAAAAGV